MTAPARGMLLRALEFVPPAYCAVMRRRHPEWRMVERSVDIVIEGYQSSANTFARMAMEYANPGVDVASHTHSWAHVAQALLLRKPVIVLVREPVDAISSHMVRMDLHDVDAELRRYRTFARGVWPLRSQVVVAPFEVVTKRFGDVIAAVNRRFDTTFVPFDHADPAAPAAIFEQMDREMASIDATWKVARPRHERDEATDALRQLLRGAHFRDALAACQHAHDRLRAVAVS